MNELQLNQGIGGVGRHLDAMRCESFVVAYERTIGAGEI